MSKLLFIRLALVLMFILPGLLALWVSCSSSQWFFQSRSAWFVQPRGKRLRARLFYATLGLSLLLSGLWAWKQTAEAVNL